MQKYQRDSIIIIETNLDDMNPIGCEYLLEQLFDKGAKDAYIIPIIMKKSRPGILLTVFSKKADFNKLTDLIFKETTTLGIRYYEVNRKKLARKIVVADTKYGRIKLKVVCSGDNIISVSPEYEDCKRCAKEADVSFQSVYEEAKRKTNLK